MTIGYTLNLDRVSVATVVDVEVVVYDSIVGWLVFRLRDAQPKYAPGLIVETHGMRLLSTGRLAVGMPSSLDPRPKPLITLPSIRRG